MRQFFKSRTLIIITGLAIGVLAALLSYFGNPLNGGIAATCFIRDTAGGLGFHRGLGFQYIRPEIIGLVLGSFIAAIIFREFRSRGGSSPIIRFLLAVCLMMGALTFLGCPVRAVIRLAGGDLNAVTGIAGLIVGILIGIVFFKRGHDLSRTTRLNVSAGLIAPVAMVILLVLVIVGPQFIFFSEVGWASEHAALGLSLGAGLIVGFLGQRTRICFMGAWRDLFLVRNTYLLTGLIAAFIGALVLNMFLGQFHVGFEGQPMALNNQLWNFFGMVLVGLAAVMLGACPMRQLILTGEGDTDATVTVLGLFAGGALARNFLLSSCDGELAEMGPVAVIIGLVVCITIGLFVKEK